MMILDLTEHSNFASRCFNDIEQLRDPSSCAPAKKRAVGGGRKAKAPEIRQALCGLSMLGSR